MNNDPIAKLRAYIDTMQSTFSGDKVADYVERIRKAVENG